MVSGWPSVAWPSLGGVSRGPAGGRRERVRARVSAIVARTTPRPASPRPGGWAVAAVGQRRVTLVPRETRRTRHCTTGVPIPSKLPTPRSLFLRFLTAAFLVVLAACEHTPTFPVAPTPLDLSRPLEVARPSDEAVDGEALTRAGDQAGEIPRMRSLVVVRNGKLILERYYAGTNQETLADVRSVTKSVVSLLVGIALHRGELRDIDQSIGDFLTPPEFLLRPEQQKITIRDLLTMSGGFEWNEGTLSDYEQWILSDDHVGFLLARPLVQDPGTAFVYNSAAVYLLGVLLEEAVGRPLADYADEVLFGPLGIRKRAWEPLSDGRVNGGAGLDLRARDLARLGQLMLQHGQSGTLAVAPSDWIRDVTLPRYSWSLSAGPISAMTYGFLWWIDREQKAYFAWGYGGQFIYVVPRLNMLVVATTEWHGLPEEGGPYPLRDAVLDIIIGGIVPAAH